MTLLEEKLLAYAEQNRITGKGALSVVLVLTRIAKAKERPYKAQDFLTSGSGQVSGLGGGAVQTILREYGVSRILAEEGGRTSRGSIGTMQNYIALLNALDRQDLLDLSVIEAWWVERIKLFFASQPLRLHVDQSKSIRQVVAELIELAFERQQQCPGTMVAGAVLEHLVGAKLEIALPSSSIAHKGFSVADSSTRAKGDFVIGHCVLHVTTAPTEALIRKCQRNLDENLRPIIVTTANGAGGAEALAKEAGLSARIDVLEVDQFVATNIYEWSQFDQDKRPASLKRLVETYNEIVARTETDPSLRVAIE